MKMPPSARYSGWPQPSAIEWAIATSSTQRRYTWFDTWPSSSISAAVAVIGIVKRSDTCRDDNVAAAALQAAGGLGLPALEEAVAAFTAEGVPAVLRLAAIGALGRMGAVSAVDRLVAALGDLDEAQAALAALTEIRSPAAR